MRVLWSKLDCLPTPTSLLTPLFSLSIALTLTACATVQLTYDGKRTVIGNIQTTRACTAMGSTTVTLPTLPDLGTGAGIGLHMLDEESSIKMMQIEARNFAGRIGADTIVPIGKPKNHSQLFKLYNCNIESRKSL